ncbi:hypothetical protein Q8G40_29210, partial [Klebsiella pneumoniae]|uniref:hypothetical protein n=1 Tax=Klebsiella pneumoniae TaxID=573 RepID=UPI003013F8E4
RQSNGSCGRFRWYCRLVHLGIRSAVQNLCPYFTAAVGGIAEQTGAIDTTKDERFISLDAITLRATFHVL